MSSDRREGARSALGFVFVPALISLGVTLWRLTGELLRWSETWFNPEAGGFGALVGITWLAPIFGAYFGMGLVEQGDEPRSWTRALVLSLLGNVILFGGERCSPSFSRPVSQTGSSIFGSSEPWRPPLNIPHGVGCSISCSPMDWRLARPSSSSCSWARGENGAPTTTRFPPVFRRRRGRSSSLGSVSSRR